MREFDLTTAEDIVLRKLECISERQWHDVLGVLRIQRDMLDWKYLGEWARALGVEVLLAKARDEATT